MCDSAWHQLGFLVIIVTTGSNFVYFDVLFWSTAKPTNTKILFRESIFNEFLNDKQGYSPWFWGSVEAQRVEELKLLYPL